MAAIRLEMARRKLEMWLEAEESVSSGQAYTIGDRSLTRASLKEIRESIVFWEAKVNALEAAQKGRGRSIVRRAVPRDL